MFDDLFKHALFYGMTSQEFWFGNPQDYFVYQDAFAEKERRKHDEADIVAWSHGRYFLSALIQALAQFLGTKKIVPKIFPEKPLSVIEKEKEKTESRSMLDKFKDIAARWNAGFRSKNGERN